MGDLVRLRVGEMAAQFSVTTHSLRAWERRYGLFAPERTGGGYRVYGPDDVRRATRMRERLAEGRPASEAARLVLAEIPVPSDVAERARYSGRRGPRPADRLAQVRARAIEACHRLDEAGLRAEIDAALAAFDVEDVVAEVFLPFLPGVAAGEGCGELTVAHTNFGAAVLRSYLVALARSWDNADAHHRVWLACPSRELHDSTLLAFGVLLGRRGWSVRFFGANTPVEALARPVAENPPDLLVIAGSRPVVFRHSVAALSQIGSRCRVALAGPGARRSLAATLGMAYLDGDVVTEADRATRLVSP